MATKFELPSMNSLSTMLDSVELVKKAWSSFNLPTQFAPTMDIDELDKRVADLKAVEQWLNVNLSMLRGTIQGLEIQRGALAAVTAFGKAITPSVESQPPASPSGWWNLLQSQFNQVAQAALAGSDLASGAGTGPVSKVERKTNVTAKNKGTESTKARAQTAYPTKSSATGRKRGGPADPQSS